MNRTLSLLALIALASTSYARDALGQSGSVTVGAKTGMNVANLSAGSEFANARTTLFIGGSVAFRVHPAFALQSEVLYSQRGQDARFSGLTQEPSGVIAAISGDVRMSVLDVPIVAKVVVPTGIELRPVVYAGPSVAFELSCSLAVLTRFFAPTGVQFLGDEREEIDCAVRKRVDVGLVFGGGMEFDAGAAVLTLEGRYQNGFVDVFPDGSSKHRVFSVMGGVGVRLGR